jgi:hypothetical protein
MGAVDAGVGRIPVADWNAVPVALAQAYAIRVKAMLHWIRKGNEQRAYLSARDVAHTANVIVRLIEQQGAA